MSFFLVPSKTISLKSTNLLFPINKNTFYDTTLLKIMIESNRKDNIYFLKKLFVDVV